MDRAEKAPDPVSASPEGTSLLVRIIPRSGITKIDGIRDGRLLVRVTAAPVGGAANDALIACPSKVLKIPAGHISIAAGLHSRAKRIVLAGISADAARKMLLV